MKGVRHDLPAGTGYHELAVGEYGKAADGKFYCRTPDGRIGGLANHTITEHEDGTITVSPSILVDSGNGERWHGFLERGVWRAC